MGKAFATPYSFVGVVTSRKPIQAWLGLMIALVAALTVAVIVTDASDQADPSPSSLAPVVSGKGYSPPASQPARYDGGPEEGTRGIVTTTPPSARYDGGPEEGTRGIAPATRESAPATPLSTRYDGGPEEGSRGALGQPSGRYDGGPEEGTRGPGH